MIEIQIFRNGKKMKVEVGIRTLGILRSLEKWGIMGLAQMEGLLFCNGLDTTARVDLFFNSKFRDEYRGASYKAVRYLEELGLVTVNHYTNMPRIYTLTTAGHQALRGLDLSLLPEFRASLADSLVKHELLVTGIGLVLSELLGLSVSTEFERQVFSQGAARSAAAGDIPMPDLWISEPGKPKVIEVERTQKSRERYRKTWASYRHDLPPATVVLYITSFPNGPRLILARARKLMADFIYVCSLEDFKASLGRGPYVGYRGGEIVLGQPQGTNPQRVAPASLPARQDASAGGSLPVAPFAPPPQSIRIGELIRPRGRPDQFAAPLAIRPFPRPHPPTPSPAPEGEELLNGDPR
ncbi:MAG: hypothetical protein HY921_12105 [Elusimicrobia bacterium]|nr:hypothetical protein [Elusimicrobiota bacterium]